MWSLTYRTWEKEGRGQLRHGAEQQDSLRFIANSLTRCAHLFVFWYFSNREWKFYTPIFLSSFIGIATETWYSSLSVASCLACACWVIWTLIAVLTSRFIPARAKPFFRVSLAIVLLTSLVILKVKTFLIIKRYNNSVISDTNSLDVQRLILRERMVLVDTRITLVTFMVLFIPTVVLSLVRPAGIYGNAVFPWSMTITLLNSFINPVINLWRNHKLTQSVLAIFCKRWNRKTFCWR